tara:strand:- start:54 stop:815 length:762 start_codon:yes stop_codon:yes gene_type:complete
MTMSDESQQTDLFQTELELMSSREDSPVRTSPLQEIKKELMRNAVDCGQNARVYLGKFDPDMPSLKTSQTCLLETGEIGLSEFSGTFPRSGTMRNGTVYQLPRLAPTTTEIGSGLWRTPAASNGSQGAKSKELYEKCKKTGQSSINLVDEVRHTPSYLPTPTAVEYGRNKSLGPNAKERHSLSSMAKHNLWPTPAARDYKGARKPETMAKTGRNPETNSLPDSVEFKGESGRLNPTWVEWLMGFPLEHTDLDA